MKNADRNEKIIALYRSGRLPADIGPQFGITGERARQIIRAAGLTRADRGCAPEIQISETAPKIASRDTEV